jgi:hypothetical protein
MIMEIVESDSKSGNKEQAPPARAASGRDAGYGGGGYSGASGGGGGDSSNDSIFVPSEAVGMIIGKGGETIKEIQSTTGCKINVSSKQPGETDREIGLVGSRDAIAAAKRAIEEKVDAVVSSPSPIGKKDSNLRRQQRVVVVEVAEVEVEAARMTMEVTDTNNNRTLSHKVNLLKQLLKEYLLLVVMILMPHVSTSSTSHWTSSNV